MNQRYWNLATHVLQAIGLLAEETRQYKTQGSLDLEYACWPYRVVVGVHVWVLRLRANR